MNIDKKEDNIIYSKERRLIVNQVLDEPVTDTDSEEDSVFDFEDDTFKELPVITAQACMVDMDVFASDLSSLSKSLRVYLDIGAEANMINFQAVEDLRSMGFKVEIVESTELFTGAITGAPGKYAIIYAKPSKSDSSAVPQRVVCFITDLEARYGSALFGIPACMSLGIKIEPMDTSDKTGFEVTSSKLLYSEFVPSDITVHMAPVTKYKKMLKDGEDLFKSVHPTMDD